MATLRGKGAMKGLELVVVEYPGAKSKDGNRVYLDVMVRPHEGVAPQRVPHLASVKKNLDGQTVFDHQVGYSKSQLETIALVAKDNFVQMPARNGRPGPKVYAVKADVMSASGKQKGLVINTKTLKPSELPPIDENILTEIYASSKAAAEAAKAAKAAEKEAQAEVSAEKAAEAQAPTPEVEEITEIENEPEF
jgi:hypothetical protein